VNRRNYHFTPPDMSYTHFSRTEREQLGIYQLEGYSLNKIAEKMGRHRSSIGREIQRNKSSGGIGYHPESAEYHAEKRRIEANAKLIKIEENSVLLIYIFQRLRERWSPEDISVSIKEQSILPYVCPGTIYEYIKSHHSEMKRYFSVLSHKNPRPKGFPKKALIPNRKWIEERPPEVETRKVCGHWEGDTVVSGCRKKAIATFAERHSGFYMAKKMEDRTAIEMHRVTVDLFSPLPNSLKKSITDDNGPEFASHQKVTQDTGIPIFFAHPYHSWERAINERTNRELRRFFPKGYHFSDIEDWELDWAINLINNKPRKRLNYQTPAQVFATHFPCSIRIETPPHFNSLCCTSN